MKKYDWKAKMPIQSYRHPKKVRLETQNAVPVVSLPEKSTTGNAKCRSSRIALLKKYDWEAKMPIQSYRHPKKIRLGEENPDPVVSPLKKSTTGNAKPRSSRIAARKKYDWKRKMPIQSYRRPKKIRLETQNLDPVVY